MSIKIQIDDAKLLIQNGRYLGALTVLMLAVAASSRKTFPKPSTRSYKTSNDSMQDREAFRIFLSRGIRKLIFGDYQEGNSENIGLTANFRGSEMDLAEILYKYYRNELVHEGELPPDIAFSAPAKDYSGNCLSLSIDANGFILDYNLLNILVDIVVSAPCNRTLFGGCATELISNSHESEAKVAQRIVSNWHLTPGRFAILKEAVRHLTPEQILLIDDIDIQNGFLELVYEGVINSSAISGLASYQISTHEGILTNRGLDVIKEIAKSFSSKASS